MALYSRSSVRILIIGGSGSWKTNTLLNLISEQKDIDKIYLYAKDLIKSKYEYLIKNHKNAGIKHVNDGNAFIGYSNTMDDVYKNIDVYNLSRRRKILYLMTWLLILWRIKNSKQ